MQFMTPNEARLTVLLFISMLLSVVFMSLSSNASIPTTQFIMDQTASQHGKGAYQIDTETTVRSSGESATFKESWIVVDGSEMRVSATGDGLRLTRLLKGGRVYWVEENGTERADELSSDSFMVPLLLRSTQDLKRFFARWGILPSEAFHEKRLPRDVKDIKLEPEPWVRLGRTAGTVAWAFGTPTPLDGAPMPGVWIEQDAFLIRKMRSVSGAEAVADDYTTFSKGLAFPKSMAISFGGNSATVRVTRVVSQDLTSDSRRMMEPSWFRGRSDATTTFPKTTLAPVIQEFYKRFR